MNEFAAYSIFVVGLVYFIVAIFSELRKTSKLKQQCKILESDIREADNGS